MEIRILTCVISVGVLLALVHADGSAIKGTFVNLSNNNKVKLGDTMNFNCTMYAPTNDMFSNRIEIYRKKGANKVVLSEKGMLEKDAPPDHYSVKSILEVTPSSHIVITFNILKVSDIDDGKLYCAWVPSQGQVTEFNVDIIVLRPLIDIELIIDDLEPITKELDYQIELKSGKHTIKCIAEGSNPQAKSIELFLHGEKHTDPKFSAEIIPGPLTTYRTTLDTDIIITSANTGTDLECKATSEHGNTKTVKVPLKVIVEEPDVKCNVTHAFVGQRDVKITCYVDHLNSFLNDIKYQVGDVYVVPGESSGQSHYAERKDSQEGLKKYSEMTLTLQRAELEHFDSDIFLLAEHVDGHITRRKVDVSLIQGHSELDDHADGNYSNLVKVSLAVLWISLMCAIGKHFF